jgi:hypothetical protein
MGVKRRGTNLYFDQFQEITFHNNFSISFSNILLAPFIQRQLISIWQLHKS